MGEPQIGAGDIQIKLGENDIVLRPSLQACQALASVRGGIADMTSRCLNLEFDAIYQVVLAGMGGTKSKDLPGLIYEAGLIPLSEPCIRFLQVVANGGQPLSDEGEDDEGGAPLGNSSQ